MALFHVIIPAAGSGSRMGADVPKQYLTLNSKPLIQHVIEVFEQATLIHSVHVVLCEQDAHWRSHYISACTKVQVHYCGGDSRAQTVLNGLSAIADMVAADDWVLVHDAARPGLTNQLLDQFTSELAYDDVGGLFALPVADTLKKADSQSRVAQTISREQLWQAQTPQMFKYATLKEALTCFKGTPTDEAEVIEALGLKPKLVTGALRNLKVTYPQDLAVLSALLNVN
ncbi:MAG TPA: 2-C-methyl-D-erythritol 4-phosphate cytidylyltransferase [Methylophilaceae bacterium]|nr:2-C-methyl-D-erythritol 4-phosphate cytidylyltransferase [Methylophilaceae bacterium]